MRDVVVTGIGLILPGCDSREVFWQQIREGRSQLALETDPLDPERKLAVGRVRDFDAGRYLEGDIPRKFFEKYPREMLLYLSSVMLALQDSALPREALVGERAGLFDGVARPAIGYWYDRIRGEEGRNLKDVYPWQELMVAVPGQALGVAASILKIRGPVYTFASTCSSGAVAMGHALREIRSGEIDIALATGHESALIPPLFAMYGNAGLMSAEQEDASHAVAPYVEHSANVFGEGSVTFVLEAREHAEARGASIIAEFAGYQYGNNGYHPTHIDVIGLRPAEVIRDLVRKAGSQLDDVAFVVGHGNGVKSSDTSEENYMRRLFGRRAAEVPLVSIKPIYGHALGASSAMNAAAAALMVQRDHVVPTINVDPQRVKRGAQHQAVQGADRDCPAGVAMSYGMGGQNAALLFRKYRAA